MNSFEEVILSNKSILGTLLLCQCEAIKQRRLTSWEWITVGYKVVAEVSESIIPLSGQILYRRFNLQLTLGFLFSVAVKVDLTFPSGEEFFQMTLK